uniref:Transcriptional repressor rco-1 n=1 Tax=Ganoderma boninense TaxID=34458 RepID=A0A5K1JTC1_9APHY|nr:Transcriptional repressor rco-1 [Ganoderma boninense]
MKEQCLRLEQALADLRLKQYLVSLLLPSQWARNDNILKKCLGECSSVLHDKGMLTIVINGGEWNAVVAIVASPDAKWIASGSKDGSVILWDAQHPDCVADRFQGFADSSRSLSFSPDSSRIVFPADDPTMAFHVRQLHAQGGSTLLSALRTYYPD